MRKGTAVSVLTDEEVLSAALRREPDSWEELTARFDAYLRTAFRRRAGDLSKDIHDELVQEVWLAVALREPEDFNAGSQKAKEFVGQFISYAINVIRSDYCPPGQQTRDRAQLEPIVSMHAEGHEELTTKMEDPQWEADLAALEARIDIDAMEALADEQTRAAIKAIRADDLTVKAAALLVGFARETLRRRLQALPQLVRMHRAVVFQQRRTRRTWR